MATTKPRESQEELARRGVLAHMEHLRSIGTALVRAVDTYMAGQKKSELEGDWRDDFAANVSNASKEFHRALADSARKVSDVYFGQDQSAEEASESASEEGESKAP